MLTTSRRSTRSAGERRHGVDGCAVKTNLEVQVGTRRDARRADQPNRLTGDDGVTDVHEHQALVRVDGGELRAVVDDHTIAIATAIAGDDDHPGRRSVDGRAGIGSEVQARVVPNRPFNGVDANAVGRAELSA